jgi:hypothetical protein
LQVLKLGLTTPCKGRSKHATGLAFSIIARAPDGRAVRIWILIGNQMKKAYYCLISFIYSTLFLNVTLAAYGQSSARYYGVATNSISNIKGGEFTATVNTLNSTWSTSNNRFILHTRLSQNCRGEELDIAFGPID